MVTLGHISDIHFGRVAATVAERLRQDLASGGPDLVVVSGDLTQRGRAWQYRAAARYLESLPRPQLVVPGNHDISLYAFWRRILWPLARYRQWITNDLAPWFQTDQVAVLGINTARAMTRKSGWIDARQAEQIQARLDTVPAGVMRVVVTHHPLLPAPRRKHSDVLRHAQRAATLLSRCKVDMVLSGHLHQTYTGDLGDVYDTGGRSILSVHAGTATSTRRRAEPNAYNLIRIESDWVEVEERAFDAERCNFMAVGTTRFQRGKDGWKRSVAHGNGV